VASRPREWDYAQALYVDFQYIGANGDDLTLRLPDTEPVSVMLIRWPAGHDDWFIASARAEEEALTNRLSAVKVGPRQAGELTWQDATESAHTRNIAPLILFDVGEIIAVWNVTYQDSDNEGTLLWDLNYAVDAVTGKVTKSEPLSLPGFSEP
jgi:hypothetical protein